MDRLQEILKRNPRINPKALARALKWADHTAVKNKNYIVIVDFSLNESQKRLHMISMTTLESNSYKVAHGKNSDKNKDGMPDGFSNVSGSYQSSLGAVVVGSEFKNPKWKYVRLLEGLEKGLNDKIRAREILFHSTKYVNDVEGQPIGDTLGCFGVSEKTAGEIGHKIGGCLLYAWDDSMKDDAPATEEKKPVSEDLGPALAVIKEFEGLYLKAYLDPVGIPTIGWGTIRYPDGRKVKMGDRCTQSEAEAWLLHEVNKFARDVKSLVRVSLSTNEFCALVSFCYNLGSGALSKSTLLRKLNAGEKRAVVANEFDRWINAGGRPLKGLIRRRAAEKKLFLS